MEVEVQGGGARVGGGAGPSGQATVPEADKSAYPGAQAAPSEDTRPQKRARTVEGGGGRAEEEEDVGAPGGEGRGKGEAQTSRKRRGAQPPTVPVKKQKVGPQLTPVGRSAGQPRAEADSYYMALEDDSGFF